ncbi:PaaI family thioesterase [Variovorax saccharolyticus]|uniref:PaaI family thioesterase n=1 Tax=Variovorax saccharolyticus TaxID=3053516 RepID=UPI0025750AAC|nr:PaaI family thioesterase [Variovorax sp. J22R187]MDM0021444.1 PaaI family thioesterase [Variovorax sp. J22R187]
MSTPQVTPFTLAQVQQHFDESPYISTLGLKAESLDLEEGLLAVRVPMRPEFERGRGSRQWHGGPLAAIIDTVGDFALAMQLGRGLPTINFRVDYLRPAIDTDLKVVARVRRNGRTVGVADVDLFDGDGRLLAIGRASFATLAG